VYPDVVDRWRQLYVETLTDRIETQARQLVEESRLVEGL